MRSTVTEDIGAQLAQMQRGLIDTWNTAGPEAVYSELQTLDEHTLRALLMVNLGTYIP